VASGGSFTTTTPNELDHDDQKAKAKGFNHFGPSKTNNKGTVFCLFFLFLFSQIFLVREKGGWKMDTYTKFIPHHMQHHCTSLIQLNYKITRWKKKVRKDPFSFLLFRFLKICFFSKFKRFTSQIFDF